MRASFKKQTQPAEDELEQVRQGEKASGGTHVNLTWEQLSEVAGVNAKTLKDVYGSLPFAALDWSTSVLGTLVGLICAQTCKNSWSSIGMHSRK